jgi:cell division protein FtsL
MIDIVLILLFMIIIWYLHYLYKDIVNTIEDINRDLKEINEHRKIIKECDKKINELKTGDSND